MRHGVCRWNANNWLTASINGELYVWTGTSITKAVKLHDKPIDCIHVAGN